jgi:hypothetical protein
MIDIRLPNITATDTEGKMSQMQSYMHQLVEQLNWALSTVDNAIQGNTSNVVMTAQNGSKSEENAVDTFNSIKALIIKSADIVQAYEETMRKDFNGEYTAKSEFGDYTQKTTAAIEENSKGVTELYTNVQNIGVKTEGATENDERATRAYIKRGYLGDDKNGNAVYGIAVGETDEDGKYTDCAWFTADKIAFFGGTTNEREFEGEVAYISKNRLYIRDATFLGNVQFGKYMADTSDGSLAFLWIGG